MEAIDVFEDSNLDLAAGLPDPASCGCSGPSFMIHLEKGSRSEPVNANGSREPANASQTQASRVQTWVMSPAQFWFGPLAVQSCCKSFGAMLKA